MSDGGVMRLRTNSGVLQNLGDEIGDYLEGMPEALVEVRGETIALSQRMFARGGEWQPVKIRRRSGAGDQVCKVSGYITMAKFVIGRTPHQMESILGFRSGLLSGGVDVFVFLEPLLADQFAPRGTSAWSGGASPRDLASLDARTDADYPAATVPVYQWVIYRHRPALARRVTQLAYGEPLLQRHLP